MTSTTDSALSGFVARLAGLLLMGVVAAQVFASPLGETSPVMAPATLTPSATELCVNETVTFTLSNLDISATNPLVNLPWQVFFNGTLLTPANVTNYIILDAGVGPNLADWALETALTFEVLEQGCYTVGVDQFIELTTTNQEVPNQTVKVAGAPESLVLSGFDVLMCDGGQLSGSVSSFTVGETDMTLSYTLDGPSGIVSTGMGNGSGEACDGPSVNLSLLATTLSTGAYTFTATAQNTCGTTSTALDVEIVAYPDFALSTSSVCITENAIVTSDVDIAEYALSDGTLPAGTALWSNGDTDLNQTTFVAPSNGDTFDQEVTLTYSFGGDVESCANSASISQVVYTPESIDILVNGLETPAAVCEATELVVEIVASADFGQTETYTWTTSPLPNGISGDNLTYSWEAIDFDANITINQISDYPDGLTCNNSASFVIEVTPMPEIAWVTSNDAVCVGEIAELEGTLISTSSSPTTVNWETGTGSGTEFVNGTSGSFELLIPVGSFPTDGDQVVTVIPQDASGCLGLPIEGLVEHYVDPIVSGSLADVCEGETAIPTGVPFGPEYLYEWSYNGTAFAGTGASSAAPEFEGVTCGATVELVLSQTYVIDGEMLTCPSDVYALDFEVSPTPEVSIELPAVICDDLELAFSALTASEDVNCVAAPVTYAWTISDGASTSNFTGTSLTLPANDYSTIDLELVATATSSFLACSTALTETVTVNSNPELEPLPSDLFFCANGSVPVSSAVLDDPNGGITYLWENGDAPEAFQLGPFVNQPTVGVALPPSGSATEGTLMLTVIDSQGCTDTQSTLIDVLDLPEAQNVIWSPASLGVCSGNDVTVNMDAPSVDATLDLTGLTYSWEATGSNGDNYQVTSDPAVYTDVVSGITVPNAPWDPAMTANAITLALTLNDGTCTSMTTYSDLIDVYPNPTVTMPSSTDDDVCVGQDWTGMLSGASELQWLSPTTSTLYATNSTGPTEGITWVMPWSEIAQTTSGSISFDLTAYADYGAATCQSGFNLDLDVLTNPEITFTYPSSICVGSTEPVNIQLVPGTANGQNSTGWSLSNGDAPGSFDITQQGSTGSITAASIAPIPDSGLLVAQFTDGQGCIAELIADITIIELPTFGDLVASPEFDCSGEEFTFTVEDVAVDDGLDINDLTYTWSGSIPTGTVTVNGLGNVVTVTPEIDEVPFQQFVAPEELNLDLTLSIAGCETSVSWTSVADVYPVPLREADNTYVCTGQDWVANINGCEVLTVLGENGLPDITWTTTDPASGMDIVLSQDYMDPPTGQSQDTFEFLAGVLYPDVNLTCFNQRHFTLGRRQAPNFTVSASDTSGPEDDLVLCEGEDLILNSFFNQVGANEAFSWAQYEDDGAGNLILVPVANASDEEAYFIDVTPTPPLAAPTVVEGLAYITYTYNNTPENPDFECIVEEPWSFQVLPQPAVEWTLPNAHVCSGDQAEVQVTLSAGATTLNGVGVEWDWDWEVSTFTNVIHTLEPNDVLNVESLYETTLTGMFEQDLSVVVTDSYGCISDVSTSSFTALEAPEVNIERPFVCAGDTLEFLGAGADVYTWTPDLTGVDAEFLDAVYFPNYVPTGDSIQTLVFNQPVNGETVTLTGALVYALEDGTDFTCEATTSLNAVVFDLPVLEETFTSDPAPYCENDVMFFEDANTVGNPNITYTYWTSTGLESIDDPLNSFTFTLLSDSTSFEVTKDEVNLLQGVGTVCAVTEMFTFDVISNPVISLDGNAGICQDGSGTVTCEVSDPDPSFTYDVAWTGSSNVNANQVNGDPFVLNVSSNAGITAEPSEPLVFTAYVEDNNGCKSEQESVEIDVLATPILSITDSLLPDHCSPAQDCMQIALLNQGLDVNLNILYFWDNQSGTASNSNCVNFTNPTPCPFVDSMNVTVRFAHALDTGETLFCLSATMDSTTVNPTPEPEFTLTGPQVCLDTAGGNCVPFVHDPEAYVICSDDSLSYEWFVTPLGNLIQNDLETENLTTPFPTVCLDTAGVVNLVLEITNAYGCSQTTSNVPFTVRGLPVPELTFAQPSICLPTTVSVLNSSAGASDFSMSIPGYPTYENFLSPLVLDVEFPGYYNAEFSVSNTHTIGSHEVTCTVETEYIKAFQGRTPPVAEFAVLPDTLVEYVNPVVEFVNLSEGQIENIWSFGNGEGSSELDPEVEYEAAGTYNAQLLVVNEFGCTDVFTQPIEVFTDLYVYVPTSFTPNNDGLNDAWAPSIIGQDIIAKYDCWVFNRTGHTVFHTNDPNKAWIGGNDLSGEGLHYSGGAEVFVWRIAIKKKDGEGAKVYEGHVTMVR